MEKELLKRDETAGASKKGNSRGIREKEKKKSEKEKHVNAIRFDEFLKIKENQAEFDRRVQKAIATAMAKKQKEEKKFTITMIDIQS